jgi:hypothetical protein
MLLPVRPVEGNRAEEHQRDADFRFAVRQKVSNPPRRVTMPIKERRTAGRKISVEPDGRSYEIENPSDNSRRSQVLALSLTLPRSIR